MKIHYLVHVTGTDAGLSGVPRVVRNLARELARAQDVEMVPVSWRRDVETLVHTEQKLLDNLSRSGGPELSASLWARRPVETSPGDWLLIAEVPHLRSHYPDYPSVHLDELVGHAVARGLKVAMVFHDILPLTFGVGSAAGCPFVELTPAQLRARDDELERMAFARYAHATALVDVVFPVSAAAGEALRDWLLRHGHRAEKLPPAPPVLLAQEDHGAHRVDPMAARAAAEGPIEFVALGLVNAQKNQMTAMAAFVDLIERRPDLDLQLHIVGLVASDIAAPVSLAVKRAKGRIVLHGRLPDGQVRALVKRARATVFLSLAEGFGLPVAESLWRGKPCLCSNRGSMAEIARGGGCVTVDPADIDAIAAGFETLATDEQQYGRLLQQIAARPFKTWEAYARQIVAALAALDSGLAPEIAEQDASAPPADPSDRAVKTALLIPAADLAIKPEFAAAGRSRSLFYAGAIHYDAARDGAVNQDTLFYGPYVSLEAGRYAFRLDGEIDGDLQLALTAQSGSLQLLETTVQSFEPPLVVDLPAPVEQFEIIARRTPSLRSLMLRCVYGGRVAPPRAESDEVHDGPAPSQWPAIVPALRLRVHDAYQKGRGNRLRDGAAIAFDHAELGEVEELTLFFGPYIRLDPGHYRLRLDGRLEGAINLRLTSAFGRDNLRELVLTDFADGVLFEVVEPAENFEIVGSRTEDTRSLRLEAVEIALASAAEIAAAAAARRGKGSPLARLLGRTPN